MADNGTFTWPPTGAGGGVPIYASFGVFPNGTNAGDLAVAADTGILYEWNGAAWQPIAGPGTVFSVGAFGSTPNANGLSITSNVLNMQPADGTHPGGVSILAQTFAGVKTFSSAPNLSSLTASLPLQLDASKNIVSAAIDLSGSEATGILAAGRFPALTGDITTIAGALATTLATVNSNVGSFTVASITVNGKGLVTAASSGPTGNLTDVGTDGITIGNGTGAVLGSGTTISQHVADTTHNGYLSSTDWNTFNGKGSGTVTSITVTVPSVLSVSPATITTSGTFALTYSGTALPIANGGTAVTSVTTAPAATAFAGWDANKNLSANNLLDGYTTTATAAGTTALVVGSTGLQYFTGSTTQTVTMPVTSTLVLGTQFTIVNLSSGVVTVQSSGVNTIQAMGSNTSVALTCILTSGTGIASWAWIYSNVDASLPLTNPMTTAGDMIYGGASGVPTRLVAGTSGQVPISAGATVAMGTLPGNATALKAPTVQKFTATGTQTGWLFTISTSSTLAVGDTYTNNANTFTVLGALSAQSGQVLFMSGTGATSGTTLTRATGAGTASITFSAKVALATYTLPTGPSPLYIRCQIVGGGGGGAGTGSAGSGGTGNNGLNSYFGSNILSANGGGGATLTAGGQGGSASLGAASGFAFTGGSAGGSSNAVGNAQTSGATTPFGGAGGGAAGAASAGQNAAANTGSGGGGASETATSNGGPGGGASGYANGIILTPAATYPYVIGTKGTGGTAGTSGFAGGDGGDGFIIIEEMYQ